MNELDLTHFQNLDNEQKLEFIQNQLLNLQQSDFECFFEEIFLHTDYPTKQKTIEIVASYPKKALEIARYLLVARHPKDDLNSLKYYGAMILKETGAKLDYKTTIPLLVEAYNTEDYRDARWSISMALASLVNEPIKIIKNELKTHPNIADELAVYLRNYTTIDFDD